MKMPPNVVSLAPAPASWLLFLLILWAFIGGTVSTCSHPSPEKDDVVYNVDVEREPTRGRRSAEVMFDQPATVGVLGALVCAK